MNQPSEAKMLRNKYNSEKTHYTEYTELNHTQKQAIQNFPQFAVAFSVPQKQILALFKQIADSMNFQVIQMQQNYATAVKKAKRKSIFDFVNCLNWWGSKNSINAIKLTIINSTFKLCKLRGLAYPSNDVISFIQTFKQKMQKIKGVAPALYFLESNSTSYQQNYQANTNPFHLEACAFYTFNRILTSSQKQEKAIRQRIEKSLKQFFEAFQNVEESSYSLPTPLLNLIGIVKQTCQSIQKLLSKKQDLAEKLQIIMPYIKISVQKYIFDRTQTILKAIYLYRDLEAIQKFNQKSKIIKNQLDKDKIFQEVLINKNIAEVEQKSISKLRGGIEFCVWACPQLQKIALTSSPRQKIKHSQLMYAQLKSYFYERMKMKYQLSSMEDIIPVLIVIVLFTQLKYLRSELNIMIDYVNGIGQDFQAQKRLLINLSESYNYVVRDWKL